MTIASGSKNVVGIDGSPPSVDAPSRPVVVVR
jgi:hypothetical protein